MLTVALDEMDALLMTFSGAPWMYLCSPPDVADRGLIVDSVQLFGMPPAAITETGPGAGELSIDLPGDERWRIELLPRHAIIWMPDPMNPGASRQLRDPIPINTTGWRDAAANTGHTVVMIGRPAAPVGLAGDDVVPWLAETIEQGAAIANVPTAPFST
jgi:hypothetical protein